MDSSYLCVDEIPHNLHFTWEDKQYNFKSQFLDFPIVFSGATDAMHALPLVFR